MEGKQMRIFKINKKYSDGFGGQFQETINAIETYQLPGSSLVFFLHENKDSWSVVKFKYCVTESLTGCKVAEADEMDVCVTLALIRYYANGEDIGVLHKMTTMIGKCAMADQNAFKIKELYERACVNG